jgi:hypothetical protein
VAARVKAFLGHNVRPSRRHRTVLSPASGTPYQLSIAALSKRNATPQQPIVLGSVKLLAKQGSHPGITPQLEVHLETTAQ